MRVGRELLDAKEKLQGRFIEWVAAECGFSPKTAENYMNAALRGGPFVTVTSAGRVSLGVVYRLTTKSAPPELVQDVLDRATKGEVVPNAVVAEAFKEARFQTREAERLLKESTRRADSKRTIARRKAERLRHEEAQRKEKEEMRQIVLSIMDGLGPDRARFLIDSLPPYKEWDVLNLLQQEVNERRRADGSHSTSELEAVAG